MARPSIEEMRDNFAYDPATDGITHKKNKGNNKVCGLIADVIKDKRGYKNVHYKREKIYSHILAIALVAGEWPVSDVDHIDRDRSNNKWSNLRVVSRSENITNQNSRGFSWVSEKQKFRVGFKVQGQTIFVGYFSDMLTARAEYLRAKEVYFGQT